MTTIVGAPALLTGNETRVEGREKVSGQALYTADLRRPGMLWAAFVTAPHAHAKIVRVDTAAARAMPGVRSVITGHDIGEVLFGSVLADCPVMAVDRVRLIGEYVAAIAADTREQAEAAAAAVDVVYEVLEPILDTEAAIADGAPLVHEDDARYTYTAGTRAPRPHPNLQGYDLVVKGDLDAGFAHAAHVFERTYRTPRYHPGYIEPRATLVWIDHADALHVACCSKMPYGQRNMLARTLGLSNDKVIIEPTFIGGDFGPKGMTVDELPMYYLARATGKPVKYVRTHAEDVRSTCVRHASTTHVRVGTDAAGKIVALDMRVLYDGGAYAAPKSLPWLLPGRAPKLAYMFPNARCERMAVYTNTVPAGAVRAPGDVQIFFAFESLMDEIAAALRIDPFELRLRNVQMPGDTDLDSHEIARPRGREVLMTLREAMGWERPAVPGRGRGIALSARHIAGGKTSIVVTAHPDGRIAVETGANEPGTGAFTVIARALAAELGIDPARISVTRGNTNDAPVDPGSGGSKGTVILGHAAIDAARKLRAARAEKPNEVVRVVGQGDQVAKPGEPVWLNYCAYGVELSVDEATGTLQIREVTMVADVGTIINPIGHRGQLEGGFMMGLGHALTEELYVEDGRILNPTLAEYKLPCQLDMPPLRIVELSPDGGPGPYGAKAGGEFNISGVAPAIRNAVANACGVRLDAMSFTSERIYNALQNKRNLSSRAESRDRR
jgi:carbon-monoxide dehydrogenase large subunit